MIRDDELKFPVSGGPDHRWERVQHLVKHQLAPTRRPEDDWLRDGYHFLSRFLRDKNGSVERLRQEYPALSKAYELVSQQESEAWLIEAGLLTDVPLVDLAKYAGVDETVVKTYEFYFFQIRDKLESRGYVLNRVLYPAFRGGMSQRDHDFMYKTLAYCAGWSVFKEFFELHQMDPRTEMWVHNSFRSTLLKKGWIATQRLEVNNYNAVEIIDKCLELKRIEAEKGEEPARIEALELLKGLLGQCRLSILASTDPIPLDEPRAAELILEQTSREPYVAQPGA